MTEAEADAFPRTPERSKYIFLLGFALILLALAFVFNSPRELLTGSIKILCSPANLLTDYFLLANVGSALLNASLMTLLSVGTHRHKPRGNHGRIDRGRLYRNGFLSVREKPL